MVATLIAPFHSYCTLLGFGAAGQMLDITENVVFKSPILLDNPAPSQQEDMDEAIKSIGNEKEILKVLQRKPHPNIVHPILVLPEGIFMERLEMTLAQRLVPPALPISAGLEARWVQQLVSAVVWLEGLGIVHGDLRPSNILLDSFANLKLIDFDCAVKYGEELVAATSPFCKLNKGFTTPLASATTEVFAIGSCVYNIHFGAEPWSGMDSPEMARKWSRHEYPPTSDDEIGMLVQRCWNGEFESVIALHDVVKSFRDDGVMASRPGWLKALCLLAECRLFLMKDRLSVGGTWNARLHLLSWWSLHGCVSVLVKVQQVFAPLLQS